MNAPLRVAARRFDPPFWQRGGHVQTMLGFWYRRKLDWPHPTDDLLVHGVEDVKLLLRATRHDADPERPTLLLIHGLGGWDAASYGLATGAYAFARGWNVVRMNMRGAGAGAGICPRLYHAGLDCDLLSVLSLLEQHTRRIVIVGFSLGANLSLLTLGRNDVTRAVKGVVAVCPPVDLEACVESIERPSNALYQAYFMRNLKISYRARSQRYPAEFPAGLEQAPRTIREWDAAITAPRGGFRDVDHYYTDSSAAPHLQKIDRPVLVLAAGDDPIVPVEMFNGLELSAFVEVQITSTGGHVGFVGPTAAPGRFWAAERALAFAESALEQRT